MILKKIDDVGAKEPLAPSFLQSVFWARFKSASGWKHIQFSLLCSDRPEDSVRLSVLIKPVARVYSLAYVPMGPTILLTDPEEQGRFLEELSILLTPYLPPNTLLIRYDPPWGTLCTVEQNSLFPLQPKGTCSVSPVAVQPPDTVILDLTQNRQTLLDNMKSKWRYNIKLAEKKGVQVHRFQGINAMDTGFPVFWNLFEQTAQRDGIATHSRQYYLSLLEKAAEENRIAGEGTAVHLSIAYFDTIPLAGIIVIHHQKEAVYLYGASSNEMRNLMAPYALQWDAICHAQEDGCETYDFYGIPPDDKPSHPMSGLWRFKTGFGGHILHRVGSIDIPCRPVAYQVWSGIERLRALWYKKIKKLFMRDTR